MSDTTYPSIATVGKEKNYLVGLTVFNYGTPKDPRKKEVVVIVNTDNDESRFFLSKVIAKVAFEELAVHNATFATLSKNFTGRDAHEMNVFLNKNHVPAK